MGRQSMMIHNLNSHLNWGYSKSKFTYILIFINEVFFKIHTIKEGQHMMTCGEDPYSTNNFNSKKGGKQIRKQASMQV